ncbi:MAG: outer membrane beta-barrel protein [Deltaproteobacteria bacterium]|nr:outer membrane beta-barrel protein [Deltaproteobacteria bacterium]
MKRILLSLLFVALSLFSIETAQAATKKHQFQLGTGLGLFAGNKGIGTSFDFDLEPEFFITDHISASLRLDFTVGRADTIHVGARGRYYLTFANHQKWSVYFGMGFGGIFNLNSGGGNYGDLALPVVGFQYDFNDHIKLGSDVSLDIVFGQGDVGIATRLMPVQFKWAF